MPRYIMVDPEGDYIWGDITTDQAPPVAAAHLDEALLLEDDPQYAEVPRDSFTPGDHGYHVYRSDHGTADPIPPVTFGGDQRLVRVVLEQCQYICSLRLL